MAHDVTDATFDTEVLQADAPVLVDFWAPWCGPCKAMNPIIEELSAEWGDKVKIAKMNVDENNTVPGKYNVMSIPTFVIFKGGEMRAQFVGAKSKEDMKSEVESAIA